MIYGLTIYAIIATLGAIFLPPDAYCTLATRVMSWALWPVVAVCVVVRGVVDLWEGWR